MKKVLKIIGIVLLALLVIILLLGIIPVPIKEQVSSPDPVTSYDEAIQRFEAIRADEEGILMSEKTESVLMTHGEKTDKVYVLVHGLTNSPWQWIPFGEMLYDMGYNVLILRMPGHGLASGSVGELQAMTPEILREFGDENVDIATGLGDEIHVVGLSVGATVSDWIAQNRPDVTRVMSIAAMHGLDGLPHFLNIFAMNLAIRLPNFNPTSPSEPQRDYVYRGQSTRGVGNAMLFGQSVSKQAVDEPPVVNDIIVVTNANDTTISNKEIKALADKWEAQDGNIVRYEFSKELGYPHPLTDIGSNPDAFDVYPVLLDLLGENE
jgi:carboxylesterase